MINKSFSGSNAETNSIILIFFFLPSTHEEHDVAPAGTVPSCTAAVELWEESPLHRRYFMNTCMGTHGLIFTWPLLVMC